MVLRFFMHYLQAKSIYRIHSPFVFDFCTHVLPASKSTTGTQIARLRSQLMQSRERIHLTDFGAGEAGKAHKTTHRSLGQIARRSGRRRREGELLYRLCKHYQPKRCLEFGTNLGISALYQLAGLTDSQFITMEGSHVLAQYATKHAHQFGYDPTILTGEFSAILDQQLDLSSFRPDYVFIDGNHRYQATIDYFHRILPHIQPGGILIFDDINWSDGMRKAWTEITTHPEVTVSLDLFFMGICFVKRNQAKEKFTLRLF